MKLPSKMSRRSVFTKPDSDDSFDSDGAQPATACTPSSPSSSTYSDESVELLEVVDNKCASDFQEITKQLVPAPGRRFEEAVFVESSSDSGQATVGSSTISGKHRSPKSKAQHPLASGESSSVEPSSQDSIATRRSTRLKSTSDASDPNTPPVKARRSNHPKSVSDDAASTPSGHSSAPGTMDKITVSSPTATSTSKGRSSQNTSDLNSEISEPLDADNQQKERILQVRLQRMSIDMANLQVKRGRGRPRKHSTHSEASNSPSPRKSRTRHPSTKCLESFNLEDLHLSPRRRTTRKFTPSKKYVEMQELKENRTPKKQHSSKHAVEGEESDEDDDRMDTSEVVMKKSTILYDQESDVAGQNLFAFRTPKKRDGMAQLAALAPKTPQTPKTPKHVQRRLDAVGTPKTPKGAGASRIPDAKTPSRLRSILKKGKYSDQ